MDNKKTGNVRADCTKCKHFTITWNPKLPYGCKLLGFKSADVPSSVAFSSTGKTCEGFEPKNANKKQGSSVNNDADSVIVTIGNREEHYR